MRRSLLTARGPSPIAVGNTGTLGTTTYSSNRTVVNTSDPSDGTGTVTTVSAQLSAGTLYVMTGSLSTPNFTIRAISGALTAVAGLNTFSVSLSVVAGDYIGFWTPGSGGVTGRRSSVVGESIGFSSLPSTLPSPGAVIGLTFDNDLRLSILGTG